MFENSKQWMLFLLDVSVKALLLAGIAGLILKLSRLRDSNVRHRVWSGVLAGMLLLPVLALLLPTISLSIPPSWIDHEPTAEAIVSTPVNSMTTEFEQEASANHSQPDSMPDTVSKTTALSETSSIETVTPVSTPQSSTTT